MPDLLTHFLAGFLTGKLAKVARYTSLLYVGAVIPDISRIDMVLGINASTNFFALIHTPIIIILLCLLLAFFFEEHIRKTAFIFLISGSFLHLFLDFLQKHISGGYLWFYPLSSKSIEAGIFWPEQSIYFIPILIGAILLNGRLRRILEKR